MLAHELAVTQGGSGQETVPSEGRWRERQRPHFFFQELQIDFPVRERTGQLRVAGSGCQDAIQRCGRVLPRSVDQLKQILLFCVLGHRHGASHDGHHAADHEQTSDFQASAASGLANASTGWHWLDYDCVAFAVLAIGLGIVTLVALTI
jgi:hypothetical protein